MIVGRLRINSGFTFDTSLSYCKTLTSSLCKGCHNNCIIDRRNIDKDGKVVLRKLSVIEVERLMGFPEGYTEGLSTTRRLYALGNSVIPQVIEHICNYVPFRRRSKRKRVSV